jgi:hypothetical protein
MLKVGYTDAKMMEYFDRVIRGKVSRHEPLFFYHHPTHRRWDVVRWVTHLRQEGIERMTLGEYGQWWKRRVEVKYSADVHGNEVLIEHSAASVPDDVWLRIVNPNREEVILPFKADINRGSIAKWSMPEKPDPPPEDIRRIREFDPRQTVGQLYNTLIRKFR